MLALRPTESILINTRQHLERFFREEVARHELNASLAGSVRAFLVRNALALLDDIRRVLDNELEIGVESGKL